jgi:hypothetical protein
MTINTHTFQFHPTSAQTGIIANTVNLSFDDFVSNDYHPSVKKYEVFESPEDVLALSVAWKRMRDKGVSPTGKLLDKTLFDRVTQEDRDTANIIRDYYSKKFMINALMNDGREMSPFRKEISKIINSEGKMISKEAFGPVYYLPIFYEYDTDLDYVKSCVTINQDFKNSQAPRVISNIVDLQPIKRIVKKSKHTTTVEYWLKSNNKHNSANVISIPKDNPLLHIWDHVFSTKEVLQIQGGYEQKRLDNFEYYSIKAWKLAQD